jgi:hypothetical protein
VLCVGLVPGATYTLIDGSQRVPAGADATGSLIQQLRVHRGDSVALSNGARTLTTLHVAHLRVGIVGEGAAVAAGTCQPGDYYGEPLSTITPGTSAGSPTSASTGGVALTGQACPVSGDASGLSTTNIAQTDDRSGGQTVTEVPDVLDTSPIEGETVYGAFTALAESGVILPDNSVLSSDPFTRIAMRIVTARGGATVFKAGNVDTVQGVAVPALAPGSYVALWTLTDVNGDQRVGATRFIAGVGRTGPAPRTSVSCQQTGGHRIRCSVRFPGNRQLKGKLKIRLTRGGTVVALGHGRVSRGRAAIGMRVLRTPTGGAWRVTLVLTQPHLYPVTIRQALKRVG